MAKGSGIAWTDHTFNPWWGCVKVSPACDNCYAARFDARLAGDGSQPTHWGKDAPRKFFGEKHWNDPRRWDRAAAKAGRVDLVFCASMADVFERSSNTMTMAGMDDERGRLWRLIRETPNLRWLLLTKRPQEIGRLLPDDLPLDNVWLGTTIESPEYWWRAEALIEHGQRAAVRFVSMEPLVARTSIASYLGALDRRASIDWVITGCESGDGARDTPTDWYRQLRDECAAFGVPFFLKQAMKGAEGITEGDGSWTKRDLRMTASGIRRDHPIVEQPYLDGAQHVAFPPRFSAVDSIGGAP